MVVFRGGAEKIGTFVKVKLVSVRGNTFRAEVLA